MVAYILDLLNFAQIRTSLDIGILVHFEVVDKIHMEKDFILPQGPIRALNWDTVPSPACDLCSSGWYVLCHIHESCWTT